MVNTEIQLKRHYGRHIAVLRDIEYNHVTRFIVRCKIKLESIIAGCWNYLDVNVDMYIDRIITIVSFQENTTEYPLFIGNVVLSTGLTGEKSFVKVLLNRGTTLRC